jgi:MFS transporter, DHA3 family, macrolide efflux protein
MNRYVSLLRQEPLLRRLSFIQLIAYFGAWFSNVAIFTLLLHLGASALTVALVAALHFLPGMLQAPFSGALIDKIAPKRLMTFLMAVEIATTLPLLLIDDTALLWLLYILVFVRMGASSFYFTLEMALLPRFLTPAALKLANELHSVIWSFSFTVGMAASGVAVYYIGVKAAFVTDAVLFAAALFLLANAVFPVFEKTETQRYKTLLGQSIVYLGENPLVRHLIFLHSVIGFTAFDGLVALIADAYYVPAVAASLAIGMMHALRAVGLVAGPLLFGRWITLRRLPLLMGLQAAAIFLWAAVLPHFYVSLAASVFVGLATTTLWSFTYTLLQQHTAKAYYGRVIAYNDMSFLLTVAAVSLLIGSLAQWGVSLRVITAMLGGAFIAGAFYFLWIAKTFDLHRNEQ